MSNSNSNNNYPGDRDIETGIVNPLNVPPKGEYRVYKPTAIMEEIRKKTPESREYESAGSDYYIGEPDNNGQRLGGRRRRIKTTNKKNRKTTNKKNRKTTNKKNRKTINKKNRKTKNKKSKRRM